ncbi:MAG TPA: hypothetical protein VFH47_08905 [Candidatus Thermoplasmatota archaeon]|nr:hypothetical protein [Candidatus Thermoplasmatota archaeon]
MPYTIHDTPETLARIEADLDLVAREVRAVDPHLRSLVLTGGFARGEGAMKDGAPQNDYDFVAVRATARPPRGYDEVRRRLEERLGLHVDLAPVAAWRLPYAAKSIFWYETALRGKVVWGDDLLGRVRVRRVSDIGRGEGVRLLVNRAAGLLLATTLQDPHARRIQCAKALLAASDAHLLALGRFPPSQTERQAVLEALRAEGRMPEAVAAMGDWQPWGYRYKVDPAHTEPRDSLQAWRAAREAILEALPVALAHAGCKDLEAYARRDGLLDHVVYARRSAAVPDARRLARNPTGRVRVATVRLLELSDGESVPDDAARACLGNLARRVDEPVRALEAFRRATLQ